MGVVRDGGGRGWGSGMEEWDGVGVMGVEEGGGWGVGYTGYGARDLYPILYNGFSYSDHCTNRHCSLCSTM